MVSAPVAPVHAPARSRGTGRERELAPSLAAAAALAAGAGLAWTSTFRGPQFVPAVVAAAVLPCVLVAATAGRLRFPVRAALSVALLLVGLAAMAGGLGSALTGLSGGWSDVLTTALPIDTGDPTFALALLTTWLAAAISAELVAASSRPLAPAVPPLACLVAALAVGAPGPAAPGGLMALLAAAAAVLVAVRTSYLTRSRAARTAHDTGEEPAAAPLAPGDHPGRRGAAPGRLLAGLAVAGAVALVAVAVGPRPPGVGGAARFDVRRYRADPVLPQDAANPLAGFAAMVASPNQEVARVAGGRAGVLLRLAVLDDFDGATWNSSGTFDRASTTLPPGTEGPAGGDEVTLDVHVADLDGYFLPAPDRPVRVSVDGLGVDQATGVLVAPGTGARGLEYEVTSRVPRFTTTELRGARQSRTATPLPGVPDELVQHAKDATSEAGTAFGKPAALVRHFEHSGYSAVTGDGPPSGHGYFDVVELLDKKRGTAEQFASAVAVLARTLGYDTRVVVGFRLPPAGADGVAHVRTGDAHAWAEVRFQGLGWVRFDPLPDRSAGSGAGESSTPTTAPAPSAGPTVPTTVAAPVDPLQAAIGQAPDDAVAPTDTDGGTAPAPDGDGGGGSPLSWAAGVVTGIVVVLGLFVGGVVLVKRSRRRRRRVAAEPSAQVQGAWHEALDRLAEHGVRPVPSMSTSDVVRAAQEVVDVAVVSPLGALAALANVSRFDAAGASPEQAATAWEAADLVTSGLRAASSRSRRLAAAVSAAPFLTRRG